MTTEDYLRGVDVALRDLPWRVRRQLLAELREHLSELPDGTDLVERLGAAGQYADDLRSAAGLEHRRGLIAFVQARRPRTLILLSIAVTALGLAIGAAVWIQSYQPLRPAGTTVLPDTDVFRKDRPFRFGITVQNTGSFAVRVLGVPYARALPIAARLEMSGPDPSDGGDVPIAPFHPFDLKPGEIRLLVLEGVYGCTSGWASGASIALGGFPVRYSLLWRTTTANIPLGRPLTIHLPKGCPPAKR